MTPEEQMATELRQYVALGGVAAQYAAGQALQGLVRTDGDVRVLRSYIANALNQLRDAQEQLMRAQVMAESLMSTDPAHGGKVYTP